MARVAAGNEEPRAHSRKRKARAGTTGIRTGVSRWFIFAPFLARYSSEWIEGVAGCSYSATATYSGWLPQSTLLSRRGLIPRQSRQPPYDPEFAVRVVCT